MSETENQLSNTLLTDNQEHGISYDGLKTLTLQIYLISTPYLGISTSEGNVCLGCS